MQIGLKNQLRLISLFPIIILFLLASYYVNNAYNSYREAQTLQSQLQENRYLSDLLENLSRERGMTIMYLGNSSETTLHSLLAQRSLVDQKVKFYLSYEAQKKETRNPLNVKMISSEMKKIIATRAVVDQHKIDFQTLFDASYTEVESDIFLQLETVAKKSFDARISTIANVYLNLINTQQYNASERDFITYILTHSTILNSNDINKWLSLIGKADSISYKRVEPDLKNQLDSLFLNKAYTELRNDITEERSNILEEAKKGAYDTQSGVWFAMLSEKEDVINKAKELTLQEMDKRAKIVKEDAIKILTISVAIWITAIIIAILGYFLSGDITRNINNLELVLKRVVQDNDEDNEDISSNINLNTAQGTAQAYQLLANIIEQTRQDKQFAIEASEAKSMFLANMSHEIRTPLNGIVGFTELLKSTDLNEEQIEFIDIIEKSSESLLEIINNILDLSKIESNKLDIEEVIFSPTEEFENAVEVYSVRASEKLIDLGCYIDPELELPIKGDPTKIKEILINLLSNAIKFTPKGGFINVDIRRIPTDDDNKIKIRFQVEDSGIGITSEQKSRIFEAFGQGDTSITRKYGGTGLGLTISSRFVELMGGKLDLESEIGHGTTFYFTLEFEEIQRAIHRVKGAYSNLSALVLNRVSQHKSQSNYLQEYLDFYGVEYDLFEDLEQLRKLQVQNSYDLLFIDYDYTHEKDLFEYAKLPEAMILITKSHYMNKLDTLNLPILKTLYEPLMGSKLQLALKNYDSSVANQQKNKLGVTKNLSHKDLKFNAKVLVAEDNTINQKLIKRTLEDLGLEVTLANNGLEAFQKRKSSTFNLIFMDIQMPVLDGVEATQEILDFEEDYGIPHIPIVALTANALKGDRERFLSHGMDEYTTKPLVRSEIVSILNHFLANHIMLPNTNIEHEPLLIEEFKEQIEHKDEIIINTNPIQKPKIADILLVKANIVERRLFSYVFEELKYSYEAVDSVDLMKERLATGEYKLVFFDKELPNLDLLTLIQELKQLDVSAYLVMILDPSSKIDEDDTLYVHEIIKNIVNKDLLRLVIEKFIRYGA